MAECVQVAVSNATFHFDKLYSYSVPAHLQDRVFVGSMVLVPFGRGAAARMGVVLGLDAPEAAGKRLKSLYDAAPEQARLSDELLRLVYYLKEHTFCTYYEAVKAIIPYGAQYKAVNTGPVPQLQKQLVRHTEPVYRRTDAPWQGRRTEKQQAAWDALAFGPKTQKELEEQGVTKAVLAGLVKKGVLAVSAQDKSVALYEDYSPAQETIALSPAQQAAYSRLAALMDTGRPAAALLHGVTSSGKTLVFLKLIEKAVAAGRKALVLVPEISLTPQMIYRLKAFFGDQSGRAALGALQYRAPSAVAADPKRRRRHRGGHAQRCVCAPAGHRRHYRRRRAGAYLSLRKRAALLRARRGAAPCGGSRRAAGAGLATPSIESFYAARAGRMQLVQLLHRYNDMPLPKVYLVDMRAELAAGNASALSRLFRAAAAGKPCPAQPKHPAFEPARLPDGGHVHLVRRGAEMRPCSVPMVYHKATGRLLCHYCGAAHAPVPQVCPACGGKLKYTGFGTQRVEEQLPSCCPRRACCAWTQTAQRTKTRTKRCCARSQTGNMIFCWAHRWWPRGLISKTRDAGGRAGHRPDAVRAGVQGV